MSKNGKEYIIKDDGSIVRRTVTEEEINLSATSLDGLSASIVRPYYRIFNVKNPLKGMKGQPDVVWVNLFVNDKFSYFTLSLPAVHIKAPHSIIKTMDNEKILVPNFESPSEPVITTHWVPPQDFSVILCIKANSNVFDQATLIGTDLSKRYYRLPMGNIHSNGQMCMGDHYEIDFSDGFSLVNYMFELFNNSQWNSDLVGGTDVSDSQSLFRFRPKKDGFEQLPPLKPIVECCKKIAPTLLNFINI